MSSAVQPGTMVMTRSLVWLPEVSSVMTSPVFMPGDSLKVP